MTTKKPKITPSKIATWFAALLLRRKVEPAEAGARELVCMSCSELNMDGEIPRCGICGCRVKVLASHRERLPHWGCKHPERSLGRGWS